MYCTSFYAHSLLCNKDSSIPHLPLSQPLHRLRDAVARQRKRLDDRLNVMESSKRNHLPVHLPRRDQAPLNPQLIVRHRRVRDLQIAAADRHGVDGPARCHQRDELLPVRWHGRRDKKMVKLLADVEFLFPFRGDELTGSQFHGFVFLALRAREDHDFTAHLGGELDG